MSAVGRLARGSLVLALGGLACSGGRPSGARALGSAAPSASTSAASSAASADVACPPIPDAELAPAPRALASTTFTLGELFPRERPVAAAPVLRLGLGTLAYRGLGGEPLGRDPGVPRPDPPFDPAWIEGGVRAELQPVYDRWVAAVGRAAHGAERIRLLDRRLRVLDALADLPDPPADLDWRRGCARSADQDAHDEHLEGSQAELVARRELASAFSTAKPATPNERFLAAYLWGMDMDQLAERAWTFYEGLVTRYRAVVDDASAPAVLRAVGLRALARAAQRWNGGNDQGEWLRRLVDVTDDPRFALPARFDRAMLDPKAKSRRAALAELVPAYEAATDPALRAELPNVLARLGDAANEDEDAAGAITAWARCLGASVLDEDAPGDPFGCASHVAVALRFAGGAAGATADVAVSDAFTGTLGLEVLEIALETRDRALAARAGAFVLARAPDAEEAALVLARLAELEDDADARRALLERRNANYGSETAWFRRARLRAAATGRDDGSLKRLLVPLSPPAPRAPSTEDDWRIELRDDRAPKLRDACGFEMNAETSPPTLTLSIDTTGAVPNVRVSGGAKTPRSVACVEQQVAIYFRSVPPAELTLVLTP